MAAVIGVVLLVTGGGRVVEQALAGGDEPTLSIAGLVDVDPEAGWREEPRSRVDDGGRHRRVLVRGGAGLAIEVLEGAGGTPETLAAGYTDPGLRARFVQLRIARPEPVIVAGLPGVRFAYVGITEDRATVEGIVTAIVAPSGTGVVFDVAAPEGGLAGIAGEVGAMIDGTTVR